MQIWWETYFSLPRSKCCNRIGWWSVKISWSWHFEVPRRYFLTLDTQQSKRRNANNGLPIVARNGKSTHIYYERVNFIACFRIISWFLQTLNYRGNEKYVLVLVQCHDGMITNSINLVCVLTRARPNRFISFVIIASWHWTRTRT